MKHDENDRIHHAYEILKKPKLKTVHVMHMHAHARLQVLTCDIKKQGVTGTLALLWDGLSKEPVEEQNEWGWLCATGW